MKNDLNQKFKQEYNQLDFSKETSDRIQRNITSMHNKNKKIKKIMLSISVIFFIILFGIGVAYADEIKIFFNTLRIKSSQKEIDDKKYLFTEVSSEGRVHINQNADFVLNKKQYNHEEMENKLGIKLLKNSLFKNTQYIVKNIEKNNNNIAFISFGIENVFDEYPDVITEEGNDWHHDFVKCNFDISITTEYAKESYKRSYNQANTIEELYIEKLDTKAIVAHFGDEETLWDIRFDYDNISYHLDCFVSISGDAKQEILKILNSFTY